MRQLYMKQKMLSVNEKFSVTDKHNQTVYRVQGSLFKLAKSFTMVDKNNKAIGKVTKELFKLIIQVAIVEWIIIRKIKNGLQEYR